MSAVRALVLTGIVLLDPLAFPALRWLTTPLGGKGGVPVLESIRRGHQASAMPSRCSVASTMSPGMPSILHSTLVAPPGRHVIGIADQLDQRPASALRPLASGQVGDRQQRADDLSSARAQAGGTVGALAG